MIDPKLKSVFLSTSAQIDQSWSLAKQWMKLSDPKSTTDLGRLVESNTLEARQELADAIMDDTTLGKTVRRLVSICLQKLAQEIGEARIE